MDAEELPWTCEVTGVRQRPGDPQDLGTAFKNWGARIGWAAPDEARRERATRAVPQAAAGREHVYRRLGFEERCSVAEYSAPRRCRAEPLPQAPKEACGAGKVGASFPFQHSAG
jgi:hypothetical protein